MSLGNSQTLTDFDELPKFNGKSIGDIYAVYENGRHDTVDGVRTYLGDILYYACHVKESRYGSSNEIINVKELPDDFKKFFGVVTNKGNSVWIKHLWFRMTGSGHASPDETLRISGFASNGTSEGFSLFRGYDWSEENCYYSQIINGSQLANDVLAVMGKDYEVEEIEFWQCPFKSKEGTLDFASLYPYKHTPIRIIDGMVYPDEKLHSWRWLHGMPYATPSGETDEYRRTNKDSLRVWDEYNKQHLYLQIVEECEVGDENLVQVNFSYKSHKIYGSESNAYCTIRRYKSEYNGGAFVSYSVTKIIKSSGDPVEYQEMLNGKLVGKKHRASHKSFYKIVRRVNSIEAV